MDSRLIQRALIFLALAVASTFGQSAAPVSAGTSYPISLTGVTVQGSKVIFPDVCSAANYASIVQATNVYDNNQYEAITKDPFHDPTCGNDLPGLRITLGRGNYIDGVGATWIMSSGQRLFFSGRASENQISKTTGCTGTTNHNNCSGTLLIVYQTANGFTGSNAMTCLSCTLFPSGAPVVTMGNTSNSFSSQVVGPGTISGAGAADGGVWNQWAQEISYVKDLTIVGMTKYCTTYSGPNSQNSTETGIECLGGSISGANVGIPPTFNCFVYTGNNGPNRGYDQNTCNPRGTATQAPLAPSLYINNASGGLWSHEHLENSEVPVANDGSRQIVLLDINVGSVSQAGILTSVTRDGAGTDTVVTVLPHNAIATEDVTFSGVTYGGATPVNGVCKNISVISSTSYSCSQAGEATGTITAGTCYPAGTPTQGCATLNGFTIVHLCKNGSTYPWCTRAADSKNTVIIGLTRIAPSLMPWAVRDEVSGVNISWNTWPNFFSSGGLASAGPVDATNSAFVTELPTDTSTGIVVSKLVKIVAGAARRSNTTDTSNIFGIAVGQNSPTQDGISGTTQIARVGQASCIFDGATTQDDFVQPSTTVNGDCHDAGATRPTSGTILGYVQSTNGGAGTYQVTLAIAEGTSSLPASVSAHNFIGRSSGTSGAPVGTLVGASDYSPNTYAADTGVGANTYLVCPTPAITSVGSGDKGLEINFNVLNANTSASTLNLCTLGGQNIKKRDFSGTKIVLVANDLVTNILYHARWDGVDFVLDNPSTVPTSVVKVADCNAAGSCTTSHFTSPEQTYSIMSNQSGLPACTVAVTSGSGAATWGYTTSITDSNGNEKGVSAACSTGATQNATLSGAAKNTVTCNATGSDKCDIYRTTSGGTPTQLSLLSRGVAAAGTVIDDGTVVTANVAAGAYLGSGAAQVVYTFSLVGGTIATGECLDLVFVYNHTVGSASTTFTLDYGGTLITSAAQTATTRLAEFATLCNDPGSTTTQQSTGWIQNGTIDTSAPRQLSLNSANAGSINAKFNVASTDQVAPVSFLIRHKRAQ